MAFQDYLTADGRKMMARAAAGVKITFTKMIVGDGVMEPSKTQDTMDSMVNPIKEIAISSTTLSGDAQVSVKAMFNNKGIEAGFYLREKGIFISDGIEEVLAIYANSGDEAEYIDAGTSILIEKSLQTILTMSSDAAASVEISSEDTVSREEFNSYINDFDNPHHVTAAQIGLDKVDNTADKDKPVSDAVKEELDGIKENIDNISNEIGTAELETTEKTIKAALNEVNSVAKGKNQSIAYDTYSDMITALKAMDKDAINVGQNIYIGVVGVPDLWIYSKEATSNDYLYVSDEAVVSELKTNTTVHIGYYKVAMLETQKVDLTTYQTKTGDAKDNAVTFTSSDVADGSASAWTVVSKITSGEKLSSILAKISQMFKNIRYLYKRMGTADISKLSTNGTVTDGLVALNNSLTELETKVLWTNESINTEFVAQSINIDLSQYKYIEILYCLDATNESFYSTGRLIIGKSSRLNQTFSSSDGAPRTRSRSVSISQNAVTFEVAYEQRGNSTSRSVNNTHNIPYKIIGYK